MDSKFSKGVMITEDRPNWRRYQIACGCGDQEHNIIVEFEPGKKGTICEGDVSMIWYVDFNYFINEQNKWRRFWSRIKYAFKILTGQYVKFQGDAVYFDPDHLKSIKEALDEGYNHIKEYQEKQIKEYQESLNKNK